MRLFPRLSVSALAAAFAAGCASTAPPPTALSPVTDTLFVVDTVVVETEAAADAELQSQVARLQIQLLERDLQLDGLQEQLDAARQEIVRNMAMLQSQASRAEAASGMAEAEIAIETLGRVSEGMRLSEYEEAQALIEESSTEFAAENYGGALYLATQARTLARNGQSRLRTASGDALRTGESLFALPVPLQTVGRSNVREGPGLSFPVMFTLDPAATLVGQSYTNQWIRVIDGEDREGWIFHTLVTGR